MTGIIIGTAVIAFIITVIVTKFEIPFLQRKAGQNIREEGLKSHYSKAGTPSMGGISIIAGTFVAALLSNIGASAAWGMNPGNVIAILLVFLGFGLVGFLDDYLKVIKKQNEGLRVKPKFALQLVIALIFGILFRMISEQGSQVYIPGVDIWVDFGILYIPFVVFTILAMTNAVNLTDGLDGLASGVTALVSAAFVVAGVLFSYMASGVDIEVVPGILFFAALCGGCLGFLVFNKNPAKIFMGDTGSLALGGGVAAAAIAMKLELLLLIIGLLYVIEALSVVMQVGYFKLTHGKRIFRMAPIHHHFELCGMKETQVVGAFWAFTALCCIIGILVLI
ncbi:MAG: phospho-N-acetylmuramoyl-pentapeptide-transferase [Firmicutes bacterium]|nr:phospho-N-acetylmuramoyl-pentapeptide-transferase [Bacillota bacterium]